MYIIYPICFTMNLLEIFQFFCTNNLFLIYYFKYSLFDSNSKVLIKILIVQMFYKPSFIDNLAFSLI